MPTPFVMPKLGLTMEEGLIAEWLVPDGGEVTNGMAVLRIETDKTETDVEAPRAGALHFAADVGESFACGETIGWYLADGETMPERTTSAAPAAATEAAATVPTASISAPAVAAGGRQFISPNARRLANERSIDLGRVRGTGPGGRVVSADLDAPLAPAVVAAPASAGLGARPGDGRATMAGRTLADLLGIDVGLVSPDARTGRVGREEVAAYVRTLLAAPVAEPADAKSAPPANLPAALQTPIEVIKLSGMRGTIARRMGESLDQMAQLSLMMDADLTAVVAHRTQRKADGAAPSYTDYVIAAAARALKEHPVVNSQITDEGVALLPDVHVGMAVALDGGLIVPVISDTCGRSLADLSVESSRLAAAAREGGLSMGELEGGTFSVSTLGMYGVDGFTPVINPPNTAILGVGRLRDDVVMVDGQVGTTTRLTLSLTWDHRAFDGAPAAAFTKSIVELLADPAALDATG